MTIIDYFEQPQERQEYWQEEIAKGDWRAAEFLHEQLKNNNVKPRYGETTRLLLLTEGEELLAFCDLAEKDEIETDLTPWIGFVYTFPDHRGHRCSQKLINHALSLAASDGYKRVYISSNEVGLYEKYGFKPLQKMTDVWGGETQVFVFEV
ncbi:MAG: GNAT family N-acetyltransferase [Oscillospiraceae bacterium]|nr:GNAT family N-acetyltransferase [Oscillospiraceae bacterium]